MALYTGFALSADWTTLFGIGLASYRNRMSTLTCLYQFEYLEFEHLAPIRLTPEGFFHRIVLLNESQFLTLISPLPLTRYRRTQNYFTDRVIHR